MLAVFVVFTSVVEFLIIAIYMGGIPVAEHDRKEPIGLMRDDDPKTTLGKTNTKKRNLELLTLNRAPLLNKRRNAKV